MSHISEPLNLAQLRERANDQGFITVDVLVTTEDMVGVEFDTFLDSLAELATGSSIGLLDIGYTAVGVHEGSVIMRVEAVVNFADLDERFEECEESFASDDDLAHHLNVVHGVDPDTIEPGEEESLHEQLMDKRG